MDYTFIRQIVNGGGGMERWIECSAAEQRILEALWVRGSGTAADLAAAADVGERLASVCLTRLEQKGAVQRIERENGVVYAPHVQRVEVWAAQPVRPAKGGLLCLALPMGGGAKALKARFSLVAKRPAMKCATAAASAVCVILACLVAVTGRSGAEAYRGFGRLAAGQETVLTQAGGSASIHGKTLANYLRTRHWAALSTEEKAMRWWRVIWTDGLRGFARPWLLLTEMWGRQPSCLLRGRTVPACCARATAARPGRARCWMELILHPMERAHREKSMHGAKTAGTLTISGLKTPGAAMRKRPIPAAERERRSFWSQMTAACILCRRREAMQRGH